MLLIGAVGVNKWWFWWGVPLLAVVVLVSLGSGGTDEDADSPKVTPHHWIFLGLVVLYVGNMLGTLVNWDSPGEPDPNRECVGDISNESC